MEKEARPFKIAPTKSGYLAIVGIEDFRLKESDAKGHREPDFSATRWSDLL
jgi:hypothetical protein